MIRIKQKWGFAFLFFIALIYVIIFLLGISSSSKGVTEIYFADRITKAHKILIDRYNEINKGKVKVIPIDFSNFDFSTNDRKELLARSLRGRGDGIDLLAVDIIWVQRFARWCEPLDKYFSKNEKDKLLDLTMQSCYYENDLVAVPLDISLALIYYREDILKSLPNGDEILSSLGNLTWEKFIELGQQINLQNPFFIFPAADYEGLICVFMELLTSIEPEYFGKYSFNLNTEAAKKALTLLVDFVNKFNLSPKEVTEFTEVPSFSYYLKNDGLFIRGWQTYRKDFEESPIDLDKEKKLKTMPVPSFSGGKKTSTFGGWNLMIPKFSENKLETVNFIKFLLSESSQEVIYDQAGFAPVIKKFYTDENYLKKYPEIIELKKIYDTGIFRPALPEYTKFSKIMAHYFTLAIKNKISVDQALTMASQEILYDKMLVK
ncbi:MAG: extracellular solute-binding protein [Ignavibacteriae bacterium]|nr:extracellular solute-binding protein [Ignavibacteriota bacterium]